MAAQETRDEGNTGKAAAGDSRSDDGSEPSGVATDAAGRREGTRGTDPAGNGMAAIGSSGDGPEPTGAGIEVDATGSEDGGPGQPSLHELVSRKVAQLFHRVDASECDGLYRLVIGEVEGSLLEAVMRETRGNHGQAARLLGISRGTLRKKLRTHGLI